MTNPCKKHEHIDNKKNDNNKKNIPLMKNITNVKIYTPP